MNRALDVGSIVATGDCPVTHGVSTADGAGVADADVACPVGANCHVVVSATPATLGTATTTKGTHTTTKGTHNHTDGLAASGSLSSRDYDGDGNYDYDGDGNYDYQNHNDPSGEIFERRLQARRPRSKRSLADGFKKNKAINEVLDKSTIMTLYKMITGGVISGVDGPIKAGKESVVFAGQGADGLPVALKIYLVGTSNFKQRHRYVKGDPRFSSVKRSTRSVVYQWARKEFRNLMQCSESGIPVPRPIHVANNVLVMEFVGADYGDNNNNGDDNDNDNSSDDDNNYHNNDNSSDDDNNYHNNNGNGNDDNYNYDTGNDNSSDDDNYHNNNDNSSDDDDNYNDDTDTGNGNDDGSNGNGNGNNDNRQMLVRPAVQLLRFPTVDHNDYLQAISHIRSMYDRARLVHGDYSEYNIFKTSNRGLVVFDLGSAVDRRHPNSRALLQRDINNITRFFKKRGVEVEDPDRVLGGFAVP